MLPFFVCFLFNNSYLGYIGDFEIFMLIFVVILVAAAAAFE